MIYNTTVLNKTCQQREGNSQVSVICSHEVMIRYGILPTCHDNGYGYYKCFGVLHWGQLENQIGKPLRVSFICCRLVHADDCQILAAYPLQITSHYARLHMCSACQIRTVRWMVERSIVSPADPDHYCDICFKMLHYNKKGEKICDFKAYRYTDNVYSTYRRWFYTIFKSLWISWLCAI